MQLDCNNLHQKGRRGVNNAHRTGVLRPEPHRAEPNHVAGVRGVDDEPGSEVHADVARCSQGAVAAGNEDEVAWLDSRQGAAGSVGDLLLCGALQLDAGSGPRPQHEP